MLKKRIINVISLTFLLSVCLVVNAPAKSKKDLQNKQDKPEPVYVEDVKMLCDFETAEDIKPDKIFVEIEEVKDPQNFKVELSKEYVTSGKSSLKMTFPTDAPYPGIHFINLPKDWSQYDKVQLDIYNSQDEILETFLAVADEDAGFTEKSYFGTNKFRCSTNIRLQPGKNTLEWELAGLLVHDRSREVEWSKIKRVAFGCNNPPAGAVIYIDNFRLTKTVLKETDKEKKENKKTANKSKGPKAALVLDVAKGEMPGAISDNSMATLSADYEKEIGLALKITLAHRDADKPWGWVGANKINRSWSGFDVIKFDAYNPYESSLALSFVIRDMPASAGKPFNKGFVLQPGKNQVEIVLIDAKAEDGREMSFKSPESWSFSAAGEVIKQPKTFYVSNIRLETGE
ncbi:MAG: hypothetical protein A2252_00340 [Elusimicrobia bacterium RIFOXYA2_FULL_39_19]|nr:MAG: hypothetical protein A2252_00340 [Elusimicrobia bacterium RIFOXYA2_FULL_39_19]